MPLHFGRFRVLNRSDKKVTEAKVTLEDPPFVYALDPIVGPPSTIPVLSEDFYSEAEYEEGEAEGSKVTVFVVNEDNDKVEKTYTLPGGPIWSVDVDVFRDGGTYKAAIDIAGWNYTFMNDEETFS